MLIASSEFCHVASACSGDMMLLAGKRLNVPLLASNNSSCCKLGRTSRECLHHCNLEWPTTNSYAQATLNGLTPTNQPLPLLGLPQTFEGSKP